MASFRSLSSYKNDLNLIQGFIYVLSILLVLLSLWKYVFLKEDYIMAIVNVACALIFVILMEWAKKNDKDAFTTGVLVSTAMFGISIYAGINPVTLDSLIFLLINIFLGFGDKTIATIADLKAEIDNDLKKTKNFR